MCQLRTDVGPQTHSQFHQIQKKRFVFWELLFEEIDCRFLERLPLHQFLIDSPHKIQVSDFAHKSSLIPDFEIMQINLWPETEFFLEYNGSTQP